MSTSARETSLTRADFGVDAAFELANCNGSVQRVVVQSKSAADANEPAPTLLIAGTGNRTFTVLISHGSTLDDEWPNPDDYQFFESIASQAAEAGRSQHIVGSTTSVKIVRIPSPRPGQYLVIKIYLQQWVKTPYRISFVERRAQRRRKRYRRSCAGPNGGAETPPTFIQNRVHNNPQVSTVHDACGEILAA